MIRSALAYFGSAGKPERAPPPPVWRRLFHIVAGSSIPIVGIFAPQVGMVAALAVLSGGGLGLDLTRSDHITAVDSDGNTSELATGVPTAAEETEDILA